MSSSVSLSPCFFRSPFTVSSALAELTALYDPDPSDWLQTTQVKLYSDGIVVNTGKAEELGICDGDEIEVRSAVGAIRGIARLRQGVRPDVVLMIGQWGHWKTPYAKDLKRPSANDLIPMNMDLIDGAGSTVETTKVAVSLVEVRT